MNSFKCSDSQLNVVDAQASKSSKTNNQQAKHSCRDDEQGGVDDADLQPQQPLSHEDEGIYFCVLFYIINRVHSLYGINVNSINIMQTNLLTL